MFREARKYCSFQARRLFCKSKLGLETQTDPHDLTGRTAGNNAGAPTQQFPHCWRVYAHSWGKHTVNTRTTRPPLALRSLLSSQTPVLVRRVHWGDMTGTLSFNQITIHNRWPCKYLMRGSHGENEWGTHAEHRRHHNRGVPHWREPGKRTNRKCIYPIFMWRLNGSPV